MKSIACSTAVIILFSITLVAQTTPEPEKPDSLSPNVIKADDFNKGAIASPLLLIQGKVPGFVINNLTGNSPVPDLQIQVRGPSTFYRSTEPLYVVDGIPVRSPGVVSIESIESIRVLKNLSETAPYGFLGDNGVVLISTKRDPSDRFRVRLSSYGYLESFAQKSRYMTTDEWRILKQDWTSSPYPKLNAAAERLIDYGANTDWRREISQQKFSQAHYLEFSGGSKNTYFSAGFDFDDRYGIIQKTDQRMFGGQILLSQYALKKRLKIDLSVAGKRRNYSNAYNYPPLTTTSDETGAIAFNIISRANYYNPTVPVYLEDGSFGKDSANWTPVFNYNPVQQMNNINDNREQSDVLSSLQLDYEIIDGLRVRGLISYNRSELNSSMIFGEKNGVGFYDYRLDSILATEIRGLTELSYAKSLGQHAFGLALSCSNLRYTRTSFSLDTVRMMGLPGNSYSGSHIADLKSGAALNANYAFRGRYLLSSGIFREHYFPSSEVEGVRYYPYLDVRWVISKEKIFSSMRRLTELTFRYGYAIRDLTDPIPPLLPFENPKILIKESNIGFDLHLFENRLSIALNNFYKNTAVNEDDVLSSNGWEIYIKGYPVMGPLNWSFTLSMTMHSNKSFMNINNLRSVFKDPMIGNHYGYQFAGYSDIDQPLYIAANGDTTATLDYSDDLKILGNGYPGSFIGFSSTFSFRNFDFSFFLRGALGFEIENHTHPFQPSEKTNYQRSVLSVDPRDLVYFELLKQTDYTIEKGDYLNIDNISLGYNIPLKKGVVRSARIYIACNHLALFTKFSGENPEAAGLTGMYPGYYYGEVYPLTRTFVLGLKAEL
ncbi:MAG: TonB-dependent receptor plug domain-containing protein [Bacteroidota bacterium]